jgi:hypothetical protein
MAKAAAEMKRDIETIITANQGQSAGDATTARVMGSLLSYIKTNSSVNGTSVTGVDPTTIGVSTRTDGTTRTFTETLLKGCYPEGVRFWWYAYSCCYASCA